MQHMYMNLAIIQNRQNILLRILRSSAVYRIPVATTYTTVSKEINVLGPGMIIW